MLFSEFKSLKNKKGKKGPQDFFLLETVSTNRIDVSLLLLLQPLRLLCANLSELRVDLIVHLEPVGSQFAIIKLQEYCSSHRLSSQQGP